MTNKVTLHLTQIVTLLRLLEIEERTVPNYAIRMGVSERTIFRYLEIIRSAGYCTFYNSKGECTFISDYGVPRLRLSSDEFESLTTVCADYYSILSPQKPRKEIMSALFKIADSMSPSLIPLLKEKFSEDKFDSILGIF